LEKYSDLCSPSATWAGRISRFGLIPIACRIFVMPFTTSVKMFW
jgi:hypothetical protein